jgi:hypothetical protein
MSAIDELAIATALRILRHRLADLNSERASHELTLMDIEAESEAIREDIKALERVEVRRG